MTSQSASKILSNNIDLIFIDGSHTFESARNDYQLRSQKLNNTGILAIHDIYDTEFRRGTGLQKKSMKKPYQMVLF